MDTPLTAIQVINVSKSVYLNGHEQKSILQNVSFEVQDHSFATLVGPNGSGKTTLLNIISGLTKPDVGIVHVPRRRNSPRSRVGYVWQDYRASLLPWLTIAENIAFPLRVAGVATNERRRLAEELLAEFMPDVDPKRPCFQLSGGQQQLVSLLRSAIIEPDFLLLDEPFSALDQQRRWSLAALVERVWLKQKMPVIFVSHDVDEAILLADDVLLMSRRGIIEHTLRVNLPRPRNIQMLTSAEHIRCRKEIIEFLFAQGATGEANPINGENSPET